MNNEALLHGEIKTELELLSDLAIDSKEYEVTVNGVTKLIDRAIEIEKLNIAHEEAEREHELKLRAMDEEKRDRFVRNCIAVASILLPLGVTIWGTVKSINFEKEGTITTIMGRGFIQKLLPKK